MQRFSPSEFDYIVVDESHHSVAATYKPIVKYFKPKFLLGITATPNRMDLLDIRELFGQEIANIPLEEALVNFQKDRNPESELELWECMALAYQDFNETNPNLTLEEKKDVLRVLLQLSCGAESFETKILDDRQIQILSGLYIYRGGKAKPVVLYKS